MGKELWAECDLQPTALGCAERASAVGGALARQPKGGVAGVEFREKGLPVHQPNSYCDLGTGSSVSSTGCAQHHPRWGGWDKKARRAEVEPKALRSTATAARPLCWMRRTPWQMLGGPRSGWLAGGQPWSGWPVQDRSRRIAPWQSGQRVRQTRTLKGVAGCRTCSRDDRSRGCSVGGSAGHCKRPGESPSAQGWGRARSPALNRHSRSPPAVGCAGRPGRC